MVVVLLVIAAIIYARVLGMTPDQQEDLLYTVQDFLPIIMFLTLAILLFPDFQSRSSSADSHLHSALSGTSSICSP